MAITLKHHFVSPKSDGADATQVQPSNWNDAHAFTGGTAGDLLSRDPTDAAYGAKWVKPQGKCLFETHGSSTSAGAVNLARCPIAAGQLGLLDSLTMTVDILIGGPTPSPTTIDLFIAESANPSSLIVLTGATGVGNLNGDTLGTYFVTSRATIDNAGSWLTMGYGVHLSLAVAQGNGGAIMAAGNVGNNLAAAFAIFLRQMTGLPAGTTLQYRWHVYLVAGTP